MESPGHSHLQNMMDKNLEANAIRINAPCLANSHIHERSEAWRLQADTFLTTYASVHNEKIQDPALHHRVIAMAPSLIKMEFGLSDKAATSSKLKHLNSSHHVNTTTMKSDYRNWNDQPITQIIETMQGKSMSNVAPKYGVAEGFKGCLLKSYFATEDLFSITRKLNPYISTTHFDYRTLSQP